MMKTVLLNQENISLDTALARKYEKREEKGDPRKLAQAAGLKLHIVPCVRGGERFRDKSEKSGKLTVVTENKLDWDEPSTTTIVRDEEEKSWKKKA